MTVATMSPTTPRGLTVIGLLAGAAGIAMLWASGVVFPFYPPPGLLILTGGAVFVALAQQLPWAPAVGAFLGLFVLGGFVISSAVSGAGTDNLTGAAGTGGTIGTIIQLIGVTLALVAGVIAARQELRATR